MARVSSGVASVVRSTSLCGRPSLASRTDPPTRKACRPARSNASARHRSSSSTFGAGTTCDSRIGRVIAGLLLAAGESTRMGDLKALLPWAGTTLIEYGVRELGAAVDDLIVVLGHRADELAPLAPHHVVNDRYREGRSTSIEAGMRALPAAATAVVIANVDQPRPAAILRRLVEAHKAAHCLISRPVFGEAHGHPTVFDRALFDE